MEEASCALANRKVVGPDGVSTELLMVLADEGKSDTLGKFQSSLLCGGEVVCRMNILMERC